MVTQFVLSVLLAMTGSQVGAEPCSSSKCEATDDSQGQMLLHVASETSVGQNPGDRCEDSQEARDSVAPLSWKCSSFFLDCGYEWDYNTSFPCFLGSWSDLSLAFVTCCQGAGHKETFCDNLVEEVFASKQELSFEEGTDEWFCEELVNLKAAHFEWVKTKGHEDAALVDTSLVWINSTHASAVLEGSQASTAQNEAGARFTNDELRRQQRSETIAQRIISASKKGSKLLAHFVPQVADGAKSLALISGSTASTALLITLASKIATVLARGCVGGTRRGNPYNPWWIDQVPDQA